MHRAFLPVVILAFALGGCIVGTVAKTAFDVVAVPVKVVGKGIDAALSSHKRTDQKRGRELRRLDEQRARDERLLAERCRTHRLLAGDTCPDPLAPR